MSTLDHQLRAALRAGFRRLNRFMLLLWRLGLGPALSLAPPITGRYLVLVHTGRKSGRLRRTPLNYAVVGGAIYVTAGFGAGSDWFRNIVAQPQVELWLPGGRLAATAAEVLAGAPGRLDLLRAVLRGSGFAAFLAGVNPYRLGDAELARATAGYRVVKLAPGERLAGPGGPGDLAWIWLPLAALAGLGIGIARLIGRRSRT